MMPDCSFEELIPIFSARYSGDHIWLGRMGMKRYGISRLVHSSHLENSRPMTTDDTVSSQSSRYNHLSNPSLMYCRTYMNLYDAVGSVIPCDKLHKHQFSFNNDAMASSVLRSAGNGNSNTGATFLYHGTGTSKFSWTHGTMLPINFRVNIESLLLSNKWWTSNIRHNSNNFHLTWESTFATISAWALTAWAVFPRPVGVTIRRNLIGLPLLRVVNNSDSWMTKRGNGAKQVTRYGLVLALDCRR